MSIRERLSGNEAVAWAMRQITPDVMGAFPITPSPEIPQIYSRYIANGEVDTEFVAVESEHSALSTCIGAGICGIGGLYYVLDYNQGIWATTGQIEALGWLAVALVIFTTWKPLNAIWGAYLFGMLYWLYQFLPTLLGITLASYMTDLVQMLPYVVTVLVLIVVSMRKKKEDQPPAHLGLPYFREER